MFFKKNDAARKSKKVISQTSSTIVIKEEKITISVNGKMLDGETPTGENIEGILRQFGIEPLSKEAQLVHEALRTENASSHTNIDDRLQNGQRSRSKPATRVPCGNCNRTVINSSWCIYCGAQVAEEVKEALVDEVDERILTQDYQADSKQSTAEAAFLSRIRGIKE